MADDPIETIEGATPVQGLPDDGSWTMTTTQWGVVAADQSGKYGAMVIIGGIAEPIQPGVNAPPFRAKRNLYGE